jgi:hypothetical protein
VAKAPRFYPKGVVVELKGEIVEGKGSLLPLSSLFPLR